MISVKSKELKIKKKKSISSFIYPNITRLKGFTMLELLLVMGIIGIMTGFFVTSFPASQARARDTRRKSDLKQYQTALESYANKNNGLYPIQTAAVKESVICTILGFTLGSCPADPRDTTSNCTSGTCQYLYVTDAGGIGYGLWARLEKPTATSNPFFIICSKGLSGEKDTAPTSGDICGPLD